jgi:hypothetical protein
MSEVIHMDHQSLVDLEIRHEDKILGIAQDIMARCLPQDWASELAGYIRNYQVDCSTQDGAPDEQITWKICEYLINGCLSARNQDLL